MEYLQLGSEVNDASVWTVSSFDEAAATRPLLSTSTRSTLNTHTYSNSNTLPVASSPVRKWSLFASQSPTLPHTARPTTTTIPPLSTSDSTSETGTGTGTGIVQAWSPPTPLPQSRREWCDSDRTDFLYHCATGSGASHQNEISRSPLIGSTSQTHSERYDRRRATLLVVVVVLVMIGAYVWAYCNVATVDRDDTLRHSHALDQF